jgi:hypothetical protein
MPARPSPWATPALPSPLNALDWALDLVRRSKPVARAGLPGAFLALASLATSGCGPLHSIRLIVNVRAADSFPARVVEVELSRDDGCLTVGGETSVQLDDERLTLVSAGRLRSPRTRLLEFDLDLPNCEPVLFRSRPFTDERPGGEIVVAMGRWRGEALIPTLRLQRRVRITPAGPLAPGTPVAIEWLPDTDGWRSTNASEEVQVVSQQGARSTIIGNALDAKGGRFRMVMPALPPGPATLSVRPGEPGPRARVARCRGLAECATGPLGHPLPLAIEVAPPRGP